MNRTWPCKDDGGSVVQIAMVLFVHMQADEPVFEHRRSIRTIDLGLEKCRRCNLREQEDQKTSE